MNIKKYLKYILLIILIIIFGIKIIYDNNLKFNKLKEYLEMEDNKCSENCSLAPLNSKLSLISLKVDNLEKDNKKLNDMTSKNSADIKTLNDRLKKEEEEFQKSMKPP
jgi:peptidoglycan hydrolase CwlO-like protein